jgi:hypothetical protein
MQQTLRPYVTAGIAIVGASLIAVTPVATPPPNVQQRALKLVDYTEYDASQLASATEANWSGLESILSSSHWLSDPDISQGLSTLFSDISAGTSNAVTNPLSELTEGALALFSSDYGFNAASTALTAVTHNVESALSGGDYSAALTDLENGATTVEYAFLNGYPDSVGSGLISPEFGLLTNTTDGAATGQIDALAQISNTIADEVANLGGANLTTGSLPLVSGQLDLSVSISQILNDLGVSSPLTINGVLGDLGIPTDTDILPTLTVGDVLGYLGLSDTSGLSPDQILADLGIGSITGGVYSDPGLSIDQILADLHIGSITGGVYSDPNLTPDQILADLGIGTITGGTYSDPGLSIDQILADLHIISDTGGTFGDPTVNLETILGDLGVSPTGSIDLDSILSALNIDPTAGIGIDSILTDLGIPSGDITLSVPSITLGTILGDLGIATTGNIGGTSTFVDAILAAIVPNGITVTVLGQHVGVGLSTLESAINGAIGSNGISVASLFSALGINLNESFTPASLSIPVSGILSDLGLGNDPTISLNTLLGALLGSSDTDPTFSVSSILSDLGISSGSTVDLDSLLGYLGIDPTSSVGINSILSDLGLSGTANLDINSILSDLGLSGTGNLDINSILSDFGLSGTTTLNLGDILGTLGLSDDSTIPLPSLSIDGILGDLGINPDENILTLLGISDPLTLDPSIGLDGGAVATYVDDLAKDLLAAVGSIAPVSADLPALLGTDPAIDLTSALSGLFTDLDLPVSVSGNLSLDLTSVVAELLPGLF